MRIDVKKFLFVGPSSERGIFFREAQKMGLIDFIHPSSAAKEALPDDIERLLEAIKVLRREPTLGQEEPDGERVGDQIATAILDHAHSLERLEEEKRKLILELARIAPFGQFSLDDVAFIQEHGKREMQFFFAKKGVLKKEELPDGAIWVNSDHGLDYFVAINREKKSYPQMIEMHFPRSLGQLKEEKVRVEKAIVEEERSLKAAAKYKTFLHHILVKKLNRYHLKEAEASAQNAMENALFVIMGWVPENKVGRLKKRLHKFDIHVKEVAIEEGEMPPTYLENSGAGRLGEDLVKIYDTPSAEDRDPSLWVLVFFALFFAMIIGDGGYGLLFLGGALWLRYKVVHPTRMGRRLLNLAFILCAACIGWGVFSGNFFGMQFASDHPIKQFSPLQWLEKKAADYHLKEKDALAREWVAKYPAATTAQELPRALRDEIFEQLGNTLLLEISLIIGMVHISLSFLRYLRRHWAGIGWVLFIWGAYLYLPSYLGVASIVQFLTGHPVEIAAVEGRLLLIFGVSSAVILAFVQHRLSGLLEVTTLIQVFADVLSYLRLYALGLAGSIISVTINEIAASSALVFGVVLVLIGHATNIVLAIIGGVIHGLRLNFIEWYHYSFEGGGKPFAPLETVEIE